MENENFVNFSRSINGPKLEWLLSRFDEEGIRYLQTGHSIGGPVIQVGFGHLHSANAILMQEIGELYIGSNPSIVWDDLPNDAQIFRQVLDDIRAKPVLTDAPETGGGFALPSHTALFGALTVKMFEVESSNLSAIGFLAHKEGDSVMLFVMFKGGTVYCYSPVYEGTWNMLLGEARLVGQGIEGHSVGSTFYTKIKVPAEAGEIKCKKWVSEASASEPSAGHWADVLPKAERPPRIKPGGKIDG